MPTFTVHQAKTNLSKLIEKAEAGEDVVIARADKPAVRLVPVGGNYPKRKFGAYKGQFSLPDGFFDDLPEAELAAAEGAYSTDPLTLGQKKRKQKSRRKK
jgi:prevent-host-death family protein